MAAFKHMKKNQHHFSTDQHENVTDPGIRLPRPLLLSKKVQQKAMAGKTNAVGSQCHPHFRVGQSRSEVDALLEKLQMNVGCKEDESIEKHFLYINFSTFAYYK